MKKNLRSKVLKQLALTKGEDVEDVLKKEAASIKAVLQNEPQYNLLDEQLTILKEIAFRISGESIAILENFLARLANLTLTYEESSIASNERYRKYYDNNSLIKKALEIVERIRYHEPEKALRIFLEYSLSDTESVRKQAEQGLEYIAQYDLDVFWGNGKEFKGLGTAPQKVIIDDLLSFSKEKKKQFLFQISKLCRTMLSPTIEGTSWNYKTVTLRTGSVPAADQVKEVRTQSLAILRDLYELENSIDQKAAIIVAMQQATRPPSMGKYTDDVLNMISENTVTVLDFYKRIVPNEDLQIIQKIEHNAFWIYYHRAGEEIEKSAMAVKAEIDNHVEYQIFKVLIGFEGVFEEWRKKPGGGFDENKFKKIGEQHKQKAKEYAESITRENFPGWEKRILKYGQIESNDLATFPHFVEFLEHFAKTSPDLALEFLKNQNDALDRWIAPLLKGGWDTDQRNKFHALMFEWIDQRKHLFYIARLFEHVEEPDLQLLDKILLIAGAKKDRNLSAQVISNAVKHYKGGDENLIQRLFLPAIKQLAELKEGGWIFSTWYMRQLKDLLSNLRVEDYQVVLDSLVYLNEIDHHAEEVLYPIAEKHPEMVFEFFGKRLAQAEPGEAFDAVPYDFHKLHQPLSQAPEKAVAIVRGWYDEDDNYGLFMYRGARLLKISFPNFPQEFSEALTKLVRTEEKNSLKFVMCVLRNYEGQPFLHEVCKELVKAMPLNADDLTEVMIILESTGVVGGEFGFVEAYTNKRKEVLEWANDKNEKVRQFAERYIHNLDQMIDREDKRAKEGIALRKFEWGTGGGDED